MGVGWLVEWRRGDRDVGKVQERRRGHGGGKLGKGDGDSGVDWKL